MFDRTLTKKEWFLLNSVEEINDQIKRRKELLQQLVGNLYPPVVMAEIEELMKLREKFLLKEKGNE